ncbi:MAG: hypothetical protein Q8922_11395 [Bacteroidota bacterium]|nr:hypothetical protein [Bacteroidota bacterium]MDP4233603.1 hypothetical protein [Bacteroidota bacterium]MDP4244096.1 hypothetical protein [Bacteroidota bacterium]MDP4288531.1 hypothetical protein [Bacteroidota bacterium]
MRSGLIFVSEDRHSIDGGNRVYRSTDTGQTWAELTGIFQDGGHAEAFANLGNLILAEDWWGKIYISSDKGGTWKQQRGEDLSSVLAGFYPIHDTLFSIDGGGSGVFKSVDSGRSWQDVSRGLPRKAVNDTVWDQTHKYFYVRFDTVLWTLRGVTTTRNSLLVSTDTGVYQSTNGGSQWVRSSVGLSNFPIVSLIGVGDTVYARAGSSLVKTTDAGMTWSGLNCDQIAYMAANELVVAVCKQDSSFWISSNGGSDWQEQCAKLATRGVMAIGMVKHIIIASTYGQGVLRSNDTGKSWQESNYSLNNIRTARLLLHNHTLFASGLQCGTFRSIDGGRNWSQVWVSPSNYSVNQLYWGQGHVFAAIDPEVYYSSDDGDTWSLIYGWKGPGHELIETFGVIGKSLLAGGEQGWFVSEDSGLSWKYNEYYCQSGVSGAVFSSDTIWDGTNCGLQATTDAAVSWHYSSVIGPSAYIPVRYDERLYLIMNGLQSWVNTAGHIVTKYLPIPVTFASNMLFTRTHTFACTDKGVYESTDYGDSWLPDTLGMGSAQVFDIAADGDTLYVSAGDGVHRGVFEHGLEMVNTSIVQKVQASLFESQGTINLRLYSNNESSISIDVNDILGRRFKTLALSVPPGFHDIPLCSAPFSSSIVIARGMINGNPFVCKLLTAR